MPPRLILNADDFGLTPGINRAILELHHHGVLTSASLMATGPAFDEAVAIAKQNPTLGTGCHLVFTDGIPVSHPHDIPTLLGADGKTFRPSLADFAQATLRRTIAPADLARETQAQIQRLQRAGLDVTHIDTHKHTHLFPTVADPVLHTAARCGVLPVRNPFEPRWSRSLAEAPSLRHFQLSLLARLQPAFQKLTETRREQSLIPEATLGIASTGTLDALTLRRILHALPPEGTFEFCLHPGHPDPALDKQNTRLRRSRLTEYHALLRVLPEILRNPGAPELIHYGNLGIAGHQRLMGHFTPATGYEKVT